MRNVRRYLGGTCNLDYLIHCLMDTDTARTLSTDMRLINGARRSGYFGQLNNLFGCGIRAISVKKSRRQPHSTLTEGFSQDGFHFINFRRGGGPPRVAHNAAP